MKFKVFLIFVAVVLVVGGFIFLKPKQPSQQNNQLANPTFNLVVKDRKLTSGPSTLKAKQDDKVTIKITVDEDEELHLHGYDKSLSLIKDQPAQLSFTANLTGNFPFELERSKTDIGSLQVEPR